jgi:predicted sulfurtransferase
MLRNKPSPSLTTHKVRKNTSTKRHLSTSTLKTTKHPNNPKKDKPNQNPTSSPYFTSTQTYLTTVKPSSQIPISKHYNDAHEINLSPAGLKLLNPRQLHPTHQYGSSERPKPQFERSPLPSEPLIPAEFKPSHIQYISGYEFLQIKNVKNVKQDLTKMLKNFGVTGRIYIDEKGINLQMCSHPSKAQVVVDAVREIDNGLFKNTRIFKNDIVDTDIVPPLFDKLSIIERTILNDGLDPEYSDKLNPFIEKFNHLEPNQWHEMISDGNKTGNPIDKPIVLDIRNLYEYELGSFESIAVDVDAYRDTISILDEILGIKHPDGKTPYLKPDTNSKDLIQRSKPKRKDEFGHNCESKDQFELVHQKQTLQIGQKLQLLYPPTQSQLQHETHTPSTEELPPTEASININKDKKLMLFCTGGIRCLKVGSYLHHQGFTDVNVLNGGINAYSVFAQKNPKIAEENLFSGSNVVFDHRRAVTVGKKIISNCHQCDELSNIQRNCISCDTLFLQCKSCEDLYSGTCSIQCSEDAYGIGEYTRSVVKSMGLKPIISPPEKSRIRPRLQPYSITQHAPYLDQIEIVQDKLNQNPVGA